MLQALHDQRMPLHQRDLIPCALNPAFIIPEQGDAASATAHMLGLVAQAGGINPAPLALMAAHAHAALLALGTAAIGGEEDTGDAGGTNADSSGSMPAGRIMNLDTGSTHGRSVMGPSAAVGDAVLVSCAARTAAASCVLQCLQLLPHALAPSLGMRVLIEPLGHAFGSAAAAHRALLDACDAIEGQQRQEEQSRIRPMVSFGKAGGGKLAGSWQARLLLQSLGFALGIDEWQVGCWARRKGARRWSPAVICIPCTVGRHPMRRHLNITCYNNRTCIKALLAFVSPPSTFRQIFPPGAANQAHTLAPHQRQLVQQHQQHRASQRKQQQCQ